MDESELDRERRWRMVDEQLIARDINDEGVIRAMSEVPRHRFVKPEQRSLAYEDRPLPLDHGQTISQPFIVGLMTQLAAPRPTDRALDVGTGSGYQAAVLSKLVDRVYGVEIVPELAESAARTLADLGVENVEIRAGDGYRGWPEHAPFDVIILAAAPEEIPPALEEQLAPGGRLVLPVGGDQQRLMLVEKGEDGRLTRHTITRVTFVPMTGEARDRAEPDT